VIGRRLKCGRFPQGNREEELEEEVEWKGVKREREKN
jgi:hypothetical protein